jgi:hypothetical protein
MLNKLQTYEDVWGIGSVLKGVAWSAPLHGRFIPGERASGTHWMAGLPRASLERLEIVEKRNIY